MPRVKRPRSQTQKVKLCSHKFVVVTSEVIDKIPKILWGCTKCHIINLVVYKQLTEDDEIAF